MVGKSYRFLSKKVLSVLLAITVLMLTAMNVVYAETAITVTAETESVSTSADSQQVDVTVSISRELGDITSLQVRVYYDQSKVTRLSYTTGINGMPMAAATGEDDSILNDSASPYNGFKMFNFGFMDPMGTRVTTATDLFTMKFEVKENSPVGSIPIVIAAPSANTTYFENIAIADTAVVNGAINVQMTDKGAVDADAAALTFDKIKSSNDVVGNITGNLTLPASGDNGTTITWVSDNTNVVANDGTVTRPTFTNGNANVKLTATIRKGDESATVIFELVVKANDATDEESIAADKAALTFNTIKNTNVDSNNVTDNLTLPVSGTNGTTITWVSNNTAITTTGVVTRPAYSDGDKTGTLVATVSKGTAISEDVTFNLTVKALPATEAECVAEAKAALTFNAIKGTNTAEDSITANLSLPTTNSNGAVIAWTSSDQDVISTTGVVTRPSFNDGDKDVTLTADISKGTESDTVQFSLKVKALAATDADSVQADTNTLNLGDLTAVKENLTLPTSGANDTTITWASSNEAIAVNNSTGTATVTRQKYSGTDVTGKLTATIKKGTAQQTKEFDFTVKKRLDAIESFSLPGFGAAATIVNPTGTATQGTITLSDTDYIDVSNLAAAFTVPTGSNATVSVGTTSQVSGTTTNDFSVPVTYTVTSEGFTTTYVVNVSVAKQFAITPTVTPVGNRVNVSVNLENKGAQREVTIIAALYETASSTDMKAYIYKTVTVSAGQTINEALTGGFSKPSSYIVKVFVWDSFTGQIALSDVFQQ